MKNSMSTTNLNLYTGIIALILGVCIIAIPQFTIKTVIMIIGLIIAIGAVITFVVKLKNNDDKKSKWSVIQNIGLILNIAFGLVLIFIPNVFIKVAFVIIGIIIVVQGIIQLASILNFKPLITSSKVFLVISILMIIAGVLFIFYPFMVANVITVFVGIIIAFYGLCNVIISLWMKNRLKNL